MSATTVSPIAAVSLANGLSLAPRLKLALTFFRSDPAVKPVDEWQLKLSLLSFLRSDSVLSPSISEDDDVTVKKRADLHKRKRGDPVAFGTLYLRDLGFLNKKPKWSINDEDMEKKFLDWKREALGKLEGIELNIEGVGFEMRVEVPVGEEFEGVKRGWEEAYEKQLFAKRGSRGVVRKADTVIVKGVPSRWFAEPRVSSKPSMLVTHTIFSVLGKIRNLNVAADDDLGKNSEETKGEIVSGLTCKAWVQFEHHDDFYNAMKVLCGRSMQKEGSRLKVDYEVTWDKDGYFENQLRVGGSRVQERAIPLPTSARYTRNEAPSHQSHITHSVSDGSRSKRFRD